MNMRDLMNLTEGRGPSRDPHYERIEPLWKGRDPNTSMGKFRLTKTGDVIVVATDQSDDPEVMDVTAYVKREGSDKLEAIGNGRVVVDGDEAYFSNIAVVPEFRRKGVATCMYDHVEDMGYNVEMSPGDVFPDARDMWRYRDERPR